MKLIKKIFLWIFLAVSLGSGVYWANDQGYFKNTPLAKVSWPEVALPEKLSSELSDKLKLPEKISTNNINQEKISEIAQDATNQTQELTSKAQEVSEHAQKILGESVKEGEEVPLHEKALDYGKYIYCKEVVKEYEE